MIRRRSTLSGGSLLDMVCPINWQNDLSRGLVARWQCMPGLTGGSRLVNLTRAGDKDGNHGTLTNGPTWQGANGRPGGHGSLRINGSDQSAHNTAAANLPTAAAAAWTISYWHYTVAYVSLSCDFGFGQEPSGTPSAGTIRFSLEFNNNYYFWGSSRDWDTLIAYVVGSWTHVAFVSDGASSTPGLTLYIDGTSRATGSPSSALETAGAWAGFGSHHSAGASPNAYYDCGMIHNRQLSASEVYALYEDDLRGSPETLNWISTRTYFGVTAAAATRIGARNMSLPSLGRTVV